MSLATAPKRTKTVDFLALVTRRAHQWHIDHGAVYADWRMPGVVPGIISALSSIGQHSAQIPNEPLRIVSCTDTHDQLRSSEYSFTCQAKLLAWLEAVFVMVVSPLRFT